MLKKTLEHMEEYPVVALLGPRQVGKSTLAKIIITRHLKGIYLDLERPSELRKLEDPEFFLEQNDAPLICFDEVQRIPEIFPLLRSMVDEWGKKRTFLILGSASRDLIRQSSETLAGRISYLAITPFILPELPEQDMGKLWLRGGFPKSFLSKDDSFSVEWRHNFIKTFLERDIPQLGYRIPSSSLGRLWKMLAHGHGQVLNSSKLAGAMSVSSHTINSYMDVLEKTFMIRILRPFEVNVKKRFVKSPKIYIRDSGILHSLLEIETMNSLFGHYSYGLSFEGFIIENITSFFFRWNFYFYRTKSGAEIDLIMAKGQRIVAIEIKTSKAPKLDKGFWQAIQDIKATEKYLIAPVDSVYTTEKKVTVLNLSQFFKMFTP